MRFTRHCAMLFLGAPAAKTRDAAPVRWNCGCAGVINGESADVVLCYEHLRAMMPVHPPKSVQPSHGIATICCGKTIAPIKGD